MLVANKILTANEIFATNEIDGIKSGDKLIEKYVKSKTRKLSKSKKPLALEHVFILLRLALTNIWIKTKAAYFLGK